MLFVSIAIALLVMTGVLNFVVAPLIAGARGHSGAVWFFIGVFWCVLFSLGSLLAYPYAVGILIAAGMDGTTAALLSLAIFGAWANAPVIILWMIAPRHSAATRAAGSSFSKARRRQLAVRGARRKRQTESLVHEADNYPHQAPYYGHPASCTRRHVR